VERINLDTDISKTNFEHIFFNPLTQTTAFAKVNQQNEQSSKRMKEMLCDPDDSTVDNVETRSIKKRKPKKVKVKAVQSASNDDENKRRLRPRKPKMDTTQKGQSTPSSTEMQSPEGNNGSSLPLVRVVSGWEMVDELLSRYKSGKAQLKSKPEHLGYDSPLEELSSDDGNAYIKCFIVSMVSLKL